MSTEHDGVRDLLAAWAVGALPPADEKTVPPHLAQCEQCATEAERLRETVRLLNGTHHGTHHGMPTPRAAAEAPTETTAEATAAAATERNTRAQRNTRAERNGVGRTGPSPNGQAEPGGVLALALRARPAAARVADHAAPYAGAVAGLQALLAELDGDGGAWGTPVVHDWDVHGTVAHLLAADEPLVRRLGLNTRVPDSRIPADLPWVDAWAVRTADVIAHERARTPDRTLAAWRAQAASLLASPEAHDPGLAARATTLMGLRLPIADHFLVRAFEVWIHTDDIGRALGRAVPPPPDPHLWQLIRLAVRILGLALGPTAPSVRFTVTGAGRDDQWVLGSEHEPVRAELALGPVDFCLLVGGRHDPGAIPRTATGDELAVRNVLERAASLSWL
ncbi:maleylpyruvate isomerase family mycothiol-dependent enzyme [Streptomyces cavernae]|uniref:maleylpyruvate isomerase family mycothiol-dependent enzyme n=1 Tax=Streptomyces cavernae TaxID=2259034 RepID=UPI000FEB8831|nr:maleylpyruvate isomerase family mycothiol-dependent enzyme [Streptomyces cavernae]